MCRAAGFAVTLLLCAAAINLSAHAQEIQSDSGRAITNTMRPVYPDLARSLRLEGIVKLKVTVGPNGTVKDVQTLGGNPLLAKAAEQAIYKWTWARSKDESTELVEVKFRLH